MTDELFTIPVCKSPRLLWVEKHGILTHCNKECEPPWIAICPSIDDIGKSIGQIMAESCRMYDECGLMGYGETETEAMQDLAVRAGIKLWNEV